MEFFIQLKQCLKGNSFFSRSKLIFVILLKVSLGYTQQPFITDEKVTIDSDNDGVYDVVAVDMDQDGDMDLISCAYYADQIFWHENDGTENFTRHTIFSSADGPRKVIALDIDMDGDIDVASASYIDDAIRWYENDGQFNFAEHLISTSANGAYSVFAADLDDDGDIDLGSSSVVDDDLVWYENDGQQNFIEKEIDYNITNPYMAKVFDIDNDGAIDVLATDGNYISVFSYGVCVSFPSGAQYDCIKPTSTIIIEAFNSRDFEVIDADLDGDYDVVIATNDTWDGLVLSRNNGQNDFEKVIIDPTMRSYRVGTGDFDLDGDLDIALNSLSNNTVNWYTNQGLYFTSNYLSQASSPYGLAVTDLDVDGDVDIVSSSYSSDQIFWIKNHLDPAPEASFLSYSMPYQIVESFIDEENLEIEVSFSDTTDLTSLRSTFTLSDGANAYVAGQLQQSGTTANDFTNPVSYNVYAEDSSVINNYTVTANIFSSANDILDYSLLQQIEPFIIDDSLYTISGMASSTSTDLIAAFSLSPDASATVSSQVQTSGSTINNYSSPLIYRITAEDGVTYSDWTIDIQILSPETDFSSFSLPGTVGSAVINSSGHTIDISFSDLTDRSSLIASFNLSEGATTSVEGLVQQSGSTANDFSGNSIVYTVLAEDGITSQDWTVNITTLSSATVCNYFMLPGALNSGLIDDVNNKITVDYLNTANLAALVAQFSFAEGTTITVQGQSQTSGVSLLDFRFPVDYMVVAEDQTTNQTWTVEINPISLCDHLAGFGLNCDTLESKLNIDSTLAGTGLKWNNGALNVEGYDSLASAYNERGSVIAGTGLVWNGATLDVDGNSLAGNGLLWNGASIEFDGSSVISNDFEWDPVNKKIGLKDGYASLFNKINESSIYFSASDPTQTQVGIGTSIIPTGYMLAVAGDVIANEVTVKLPSDWPDYVFEEDFDLLPLKTLSDYIKEHRHLPGIPSAQQVEEEGIDLGEMNALLLKKIEELTLYSIDQEKRIIEQSETLNSLMERNRGIIEELEKKLKEN